MEIDFDTKHPIVLDARHTFVKLFLRHTYLKNYHQGIDYLQSKLQERCAILKLRSTLRSIKSNCVLCRKFSAATTQPIMADLSKERLAYQSPPLPTPGLITSVHSTSQFVGLPRRGGFLFTCLSTCAVHVEIVPSMDTSSGVLGVKRFVSRRGTPAMVWSDNGTNFIGAEKKLRKCIEKWNTLNIAAELAHKGIEWKINPSSAPQKVASGTDWSVVLRGYCIQSPVHATSQMRC